MRMLRKLLLMLRVENNLNESGLHYVCNALFLCICVPGGGLEPFRRVIFSGMVVCFPFLFRGSILIHCLISG